MDSIRHHLTSPIAAALWTAIAALTVIAVLITPATAGDEEADATTVALAVSDHERRPIAPTQRDQLGLVLYAFMAVVTIAGVATLRRQLKGERPQTDGEFRWR